MIEVIVQNGEDAIEAEKLGAKRLEFVSAISEGGLTPSYGTIKLVLNSVSIPVFVMIRPHSHHFFYNESDMEIIKEDINQVLKLGGTRIVFGALHKDRTINEEMLKEVIAISPELEITFHRAFDEIADQLTAYKTLAKYEQVKWILTSGGKDTCAEGKEGLRALVELSREIDGPGIMPGSGLNPDNLSEIHQVVQADQYHFGSAVRNQQSFAKGYNKQAVKRIFEVLT